MQLFDLHTHTTYSDGRDTPEEMIHEALERGLMCFGISDHSPTPFDPPGGMPEGTERLYAEAIRKLKARFDGKIRLLLGLEQDFWSPAYEETYDYIIGSVHYLYKNGCYLAVDDTPEIFEEGVDRLFGGDFLTACECFYDQEAAVAEKTGCGIIGHFDLITKFNEKHHFFDTEAPRYKTARKKALDRLLEKPVIFEINTGGLFRGWKTGTYPDDETIRYIRENGGRVILSSDAHRKEAIAWQFEELSGKLKM